ncbi:MAG TPA: TetR family transcriptional regulator [Galbitalea sp.]|jgi:AcrR family transcriptional regulator
MTTGTPASTVDEDVAVRSRDAGNTRQLLLRAARIRFARDGYSATTVRDIANDAGVNVALINRYFVSKEGLFEACIARVGEELGRPSVGVPTVPQILDSLTTQLVGLPSDQYPLQLMLLLRSSGDEGADRIRRNIMRSFAEGMAAAAGWHAGDPGADALLLRAQIALSAALGIVLLRTSTGLDPLSRATEDDLRGPLGDLLTALLGR